MPRPPDDRSASSSSDGERLQKLLAAAGYGSRRACEELITTGRVTVNGKTVTELGSKADPERQKVAVDGEPLKIHRKLYYLVNKPSGCLCTNADPAGRTRVIDLLPKSDARLFTVGRLDENTEGLLLVTNDGELAHRLAHPRFQVERVYKATIAGVPTPEALKALRDGFFFDEGKFRVRDLRNIRPKGTSTILDVVMTEGQNREVRRLFARVGHKVMQLRRIAFGPLKLGDLELGAYRPLRSDELHGLVDFAQGKGPRRSTIRRAKPNPTAEPSTESPKPARRPRTEGLAPGARPRPGAPARRKAAPKSGRPPRKAKRP
ncbi:MAG TPA: pseudouridine synthase [Planctomycetaceae bacterium]|nr:pseudouridine synthase [Planctomycetaceae bacterium]